MHIGDRVASFDRTFFSRFFARPFVVKPLPVFFSLFFLGFAKRGRRPGADQQDGSHATQSKSQQTNTAKSRQRRHLASRGNESLGQQSAARYKPHRRNASGRKNCFTRYLRSPGRLAIRVAPVSAPQAPTRVPRGLPPLYDRFGVPPHD